MEIDQLLFGYRDGHELLASSFKIDARLEAELLPHADARFEDRSEHYLVGLPVSSLERFMLTRIWPAPELPRPGAVCAYSLLIEETALTSLDPLRLLDLFRRPSEPNELGRYTSTLACEASGPRPASNVPGLRLARGRVLALTGLGALALGSSLLAATPRSAPSSGPCSKQEAVRVVRRLHLGNADDPDVSDPVAQVLCGAFAGPGSQAMVASLAIPSCGRTAGWVVFRRSGATWQLVMERNNGADLDAVGPGIRETQFVLRPTDAHCFPTGGTRSRTWRWNGARFVSNDWKYSKPATATPPPAGASALGFFKSPSGNILCGYSQSSTRTNLGCVVQSGLKPQPAARRPGCSPPITVALRATGRAFVTDETCSGADAPETPYVGSGIAKVLPYGTSWSGGGLRCTSESVGLTCRNRSGHGFFLSRERWRAF